MSRKFVSHLRPEETVNEVYLVSSRQLRPNRNGVLYLQMRLSDRTGSIDARLWNADQSLLERVLPGGYVRVEGVTQVYQGNLQIILSRVKPVPAEEVDPADFLPLTQQKLDQNLNYLAQILRSVENPHLRALLEVFLTDEEFMAKLAKVPAGVSFHHAYPGGLVVHLVTMLELAQAMAPLYPAVNRDLLLVGVFLHDIGKTAELATDFESNYTDEGQLLGHLALGLEMLNEAIPKAEELVGEQFPSELRLRLKHMILSHHGEYEFGSFRLPMTPEAVALHCLDYLDSRMAACLERIQGDPLPEGTWTSYCPVLNRKFYKGAGSTTADDHES